MPGFPVLHYLLDFVISCLFSRWCHPTFSSSDVSSSPPALNLSQCQGLSQWVSSSHQVAKVSEFQLQHQSFQWIFRTISLLSRGLSRVFSSTTVQKHQFFGTQVSLKWPRTSIKRNSLQWVSLCSLGLQLLWSLTPEGLLLFDPSPLQVCCKWQQNTRTQFCRAREFLWVLGSGAPEMEGVILKSGAGFPLLKNFPITHCPMI